MPPRCTVTTCLPFLYPALFRAGARLSRAGITTFQSNTESANGNKPASSLSNNNLPNSRLNPLPEDYAISTFADKARVTIHAGPGGHGCISFLRELFISDGPANGGDGGHGGNVYIQAIHGETSLHKLVRRGTIRAERGKTGMGSSRGGARGEDVIIQVPVGTVVREIERNDPTIEEHMNWRIAREKERQHMQLMKKYEAARAEAEARGEAEDFEEPELPEAPDHPDLDKFVLYPGISSSERRNLSLPRLPRRERIYAQPDSPIFLDLSVPTKRPILLAAGGLGGLGNPNFVSKERRRPLFATKGELAVSMQLELELKLLADVGLVGLPNAGKSTLLRALTRSRARVGNWAFTTLQPNIGTVVLDSYKGRPVPTPKPAAPQASHAIINDATYGSVVIEQPDAIPTTPEPRTRFTVADIPGLIEGAHLDRGLGIAFLRHVERAGVLAFVVDLNAGDAVEALKSLWNEVGLYARMREEEEREREVDARIDWQGDGSSSPGEDIDPIERQLRAPADDADELPTTLVADDVYGSGIGFGQQRRKKTEPLDIAGKPWFVVATKGDLPETQENYARLRDYMAAVTAGTEPHPSGAENGWTEDCAAIPVSAIKGHGVDRIVNWTVGLLDT